MLFFLIKEAYFYAGPLLVTSRCAIRGYVERIVEQEGNYTEPSAANSTSKRAQVTFPSLQEGIPTTWLFVATLAHLSDEAVRFTTDTIVGYVLRDESNGDPEKDKIIAFSAACTHMGCLVQWHASDRIFHCPCHGGLFTEDGEVDKRSSLRRYLSPLPRLETKIENDKVYVKVPVSRM